MTENQDRIILIDKEKGWTSFDVVKKIRYLTKIKKVGHAGTLDPLATGLLIVATGKKTKEIEKIQNGLKIYEMEFCLGATTKSLDAEFLPEEFFDMSGVSRGALESAIKENFIGEIEQTPPIFSAIKINGQPAYKSARKGKQVEVKSRKVEIYNFDLESFEKVSVSELLGRHKKSNPDLEDIDVGDTKTEVVIAMATVECSKGTYIRTLADDLGKAFGGRGYLLNLRRVVVGEYKISDAVSVGDFVSNFRRL